MQGGFGVVEGTEDTLVLEGAAQVLQHLDAGLDDGRLGGRLATGTAGHALDGVGATDLRAVTGGSGASCGSRYLRVMLDEPAGRIVRGGASAELPIRVVLADEAPQGCQGQLFTIRALLRVRTDR